MNNLSVTCKRFEDNETDFVDAIDFIAETLETNGLTYFFSDLEWVDFGTTRWYPNNL